MNVRVRENERRNAIKLLTDRWADSDRALFAPLLRQYSPLLHESKYFPNVRRASLYTHSAGPYLPPPASPFAGSGSRLQFLLDPTCSHDGAAASDVAIEIRLDLWATLGNLVMRYRMAAMAYPSAIVMIVLALQLQAYNAGGERSPYTNSLHAADAGHRSDLFLPFGTAFSLFARRLLVPLLATLVVLSLLQSILLASHLSSLRALADATLDATSHSFLPPTWIAHLLLGNQSPFFAFTASFIVFTMISVVLFEYLALHLVVAGGAAVVRLMQTRGAAGLSASLQ